MATRLVCLLMTTTLLACGGGGGNHVSGTVVFPPKTEPHWEPVWSLGTITALGSFTMNGIRYQTDAATVIFNGQRASVADLELGHVVSLQGEIDVDWSRGSAERIEYDAMAVGPIENLDASVGRLMVMGQTVRTDADTVFHPSIDPLSLTGLVVGAHAQISGFVNADGEIIATRVEPDSANSSAQLIGRVAGLDAASRTFAVNRLTIDYGNARDIDFVGGSPFDGAIVVVRGTLIDGVLVANHVAQRRGRGTPGERAQIQGLITRFDTPTEFELNGLRVTTDARTVFTNGTIEELHSDARISLDGRVTGAGDGILANEISFGRRIDPTATVKFDLDYFTEVAVFSVFKATIVQGADFLVEVTVDADVVDNVLVSQTGNRLSLDLQLGNNNASTLEARVTMPVLDRIDVDGAGTRVSVNGFDQMQMTVNVDGVSYLRGSGLRIGELSARVSGVSELDFANIRPLASANIEVSGVSRATLNMDAGSTLRGSVTTGQPTGTSGLFYYGTDVAVDVTSDASSSVTKLGETRP